MLLFSLPNSTGVLLIFSLLFIPRSLADLANDIVATETTKNWLNKSEISEQLADVSQAVTVLRQAVRNMSAYLDGVDVIGSPQPRCLKRQCRIICFNGKQSEIAKDLTSVLSHLENEEECSLIDELYLYNYKFPDNILNVGFLSLYTNRVRLIYIGISNITAIENGAFGGGIFHRIILEDLHLKRLDKQFFTNISTYYFKGIGIIQNTPTELSVYPDFLDLVQYHIEYLHLQTGTNCVRNVTATDPILGALIHADFSYNDFGSTLLYDSFRKLTMVERLILSHSNIEYLPSAIFQDMRYLEVLDISHNKLISVSKTIFGYTEISANLHIYAEGNPWYCDCKLQNNMNVIFKYHNTKNELICDTPEKYKDCSVFYDQICNSSEEEFSTQTPCITTVGPSVVTTTTTSSGGALPPFVTTTATVKTTFVPTTRTTPGDIFVPTISTAGTVKPDEIVPLECRLPNQVLINNATNQLIRWPQLYFSPKCFGSLAVKVTVDRRNSESSFGLFWFSKTTKKYYMMELLPDEFGLGCYFTMPLLTMVKELVPNVAYTFCLVDDNQNKVSPFSCKSVHVGGNLNTHYNSWLSRRMRTKGISAMVLGVVLFMFVGIALVFLVLKQKPMWLKGSKRVITPKFRSGEVVVLPRSNTAEYMQYKEDMISRIKGQRSISFASRYNSMESVASSVSYMDTNLYEMIPAYLSFDEIPQMVAPSQPVSQILDENLMADNGSVRYAQITPRTKRISSDPLPAVPTTSDVSDVPH